MSTTLHRLSHVFQASRGLMEIDHLTDCQYCSSAKPSRIDSFMKLISPFGVLESGRTGLMALPRSPLYAASDQVEMDAGDLVDASTLPPG